MFEQAFKSIDDVLWKDAGCTSELDYTEQSSWLLFLKYLDALEQDKAMEAELEGKRYNFILEKQYRWEAWAAPKIHTSFTDKQQTFLDFVLTQYVKEGVEELDQEKLSPLLKLRYHTLPDATKILGTTEQIRGVFVGFQRYLYEQGPTT